jgi:hypothetical protein
MRKSWQMEEKEVWCIFCGSMVGLGIGGAEYKVFKMVCSSVTRRASGVWKAGYHIRPRCGTLTRLEGWI